jgi:hypothetical protein
MIIYDPLGLTFIFYCIIYIFVHQTNNENGGQHFNYLLDFLWGRSAVRVDLGYRNHRIYLEGSVK